MFIFMNKKLYNFSMKQYDPRFKRSSFQPNVKIRLDETSATLSIVAKRE